MEDSRIPKQLLYSELADGSRKRGRPKLRYKDTLKASLKDCHIDPETWEQSASDIYQPGGTRSGRELTPMRNIALLRRRNKEEEEKRGNQMLLTLLVLFPD